MKTSELTGAALDWAVANCEWPTGVRYIESLEKFSMPDESPYCFLPEYSPSANWSQGGPIIEREKIGLTYADSIPSWYATSQQGKRFLRLGPTPLMAAMRCYVASKLGDEVEIPNELTGVNK